MIKPSPELIAITRRFLNAVLGKDSAALINLFSGSEYIRYVGSSENEIWGGAGFGEHYSRHNLEVPESTHREILTEAFENGEFGWAFCIYEVAFSSADRPYVFRATIIYNLESGQWKVTHVHNSNPVANLDSMGFDYRTFDALIEAAQGDFQPEGREDTATVMFTDIANSSAIADALGNRIWASTIQRHLDTVSKAIDENGGTMVKSLGDGTMSTFNSSRSALNAAIAIQTLMAGADSEPNLQLRIGVHTGDVIQSKGDFFGTVVNKAARITGAARPGEIRVSQATQIMVGAAAGFTFTDAATVALKGLEGDHLIYRLQVP